MSHSTTHAGLQSHSIGDIYPYSIVGVGNGLVGRNLLTGEDCGPLHYYGPGGLDFSAAHRLATDDCLDALAADKPHDTDNPVFNLVEYSFLIPCKYTCLRGVAESLTRIFGGCTVEHDIDGYWQDTDLPDHWSALEHDRLVRYTVATDSSREAELTRFATGLASDCGETAVYISKGGYATIIYV